jgi:hypothetical protein
MKSWALSLIVMTSLFFVACGSGNTTSPPAASYTIGGMVTGLSGTGLVLQDDGGANLPVSANGAFTFTRAVTSGGTYKVTVLTQPSSPAQTCAVTGGSGTASANLTSVQVACTTNSTTFGVSSLNGTYVFSSTAIFLRSAAGDSFATMVGSLTANGTGGVTGGTVDLSGYPPTFTTLAAQPITGGSYSVGADGRGQIKFETNLGAGAATITLDFVLTSSSHGLVIEYDSNGAGSGTIDLQSPITQSQLAGSYAFAFSGTTANGATPIATVGAFTLDSTGAVSTGQEDVNIAGSYSGAPSQILTGSAVTLGTTPATATIASSAGTSYTFDVYPIDSGHLKFIENDSQLLLSGDAYTQASSIPTGQLVFTLAGEYTVEVTGHPPSALPIDSGGWLTNSSATITAGLEDFNGHASTVGQANSVSGSFSAVSGARSVLSLSGFVNGAANDVPGNYSFAAYPFTFSGGVVGIQLLEIDGLGISSGIAYAQTSTTLTASQGYGLNLSALTLNEVETVVTIEEDAIAEFTTTTDGLSGFIDLNYPGFFGGGGFDQTLTGSFPAPVDHNGRGTATTNYFDFDYYVVNSSTFLLLETDVTNLVGTGIFELQNPADSPGAEPGVSPLHPSFHAHAARQKKK